MGYNLLLHIHGMIPRTNPRTGGAVVEVRSVQGALPPFQDITVSASHGSASKGQSQHLAASCTGLAHKETGLANTRRKTEGTMV